MTAHVLSGTISSTSTLTGRMSGGTGTFGEFRLGAAGSEIILPDLNEYHIDRVIQGGIHILLNGKARADEIGQRKHFYLAWRGLTTAEADQIDSVFYATAPLVFMDKDDAYLVVRGNHAPRVFDTVGYVSFNVELEETV